MCCWISCSRSHSISLRAAASLNALSPCLLWAHTRSPFSLCLHRRLLRQRKPRKQQQHQHQQLRLFLLLLLAHLSVHTRRDRRLRSAQTKARQQQQQQQRVRAASAERDVLSVDLLNQNQRRHRHRHTFPHRHRQRRNDPAHQHTRLRTHRHQNTPKRKKQRKTRRCAVLLVCCFTSCKHVNRKCPLSSHTLSHLVRSPSCLCRLSLHLHLRLFCRCIFSVRCSRCFNRSLCALPQPMRYTRQTSRHFACLPALRCTKTGNSHAHPPYCCFCPRVRSHAPVNKCYTSCCCPVEWIG